MQSHSYSPPTTGFKVSTEPLELNGSGTVRLASLDAGDAPLIDPNYLETQADVDHYVEGIRQGLGLV